MCGLDDREGVQTRSNAAVACSVVVVTMRQHVNLLAGIHRVVERHRVDRRPVFVEYVRRLERGLEADDAPAREGVVKFARLDHANRHTATLGELAAELRLHKLFIGQRVEQAQVGAVRGENYFQRPFLGPGFGPLLDYLRLGHTVPYDMAAHQFYVSFVELWH